MIKLLPYLFAWVLAVVVGCHSQRRLEDLGRANMVQIWDLQISDANARPIEIRDPKAIETLATAIAGAPGLWQQDSKGMSTGYLTIGFWKGEHLIARFGFGEGFLVRGNGADRQTKRISKTLEEELAKYATPLFSR